MLKNFLPIRLLEFIKQLRDYSAWKQRGYLDQSPQLVKQNVFMKYGIKGASWVETGTYLGTTTNYLKNLFHQEQSKQ